MEFFDNRELWIALYFYQKKLNQLPIDIKGFLNRWEENSELLYISTNHSLKSQKASWNLKTDQENLGVLCTSTHNLSFNSH